MSNQSFVLKNFLKIFYIENKKGKYLEGRYFPNVAKKSEYIKRINKILKDRYGTKPKNDKNRIFWNDKKAVVQEQRAQELEKSLSDIVEKIHSGNVNLDLRNSVKVSDKQTYQMVDDGVNYFLNKQIQRNFKETFNITITSRDNAIERTVCALRGGVEKYVIKADIKSFYENIDRDILKLKLYKTPDLSFTTKRFTRKILHNYYDMNPQGEKGVPRGIGISAYLAELYLQSFDAKIRAMENLVFYMRYVDDIICIFSVEPKVLPEEYYLGKINSFLSCEKLELNEDKCQETKSSHGYFDYLGYKFKYHGDSVELSITTNKIERIKERIILCFKDYKNVKNDNKLLIKRILFLASNTKLLNSKKSVLTGIYFNNKHISSTNSPFIGLDQFYQHQINTLLHAPREQNLKNKLCAISFDKGFKEKPFIKYSTQDISKITSVWKNA